MGPLGGAGHPESSLEGEKGVDPGKGALPDARRGADRAKAWYS